MDSRRMSYLKWCVTRGLVPLVALGLLGSACEDSGGDALPGLTVPDVQPGPTPGQTQFVSADGHNGQTSQSGDDNASNNMAGAPNEGADSDSGDPRTVEEGDIYRVMAGANLLLNLNSYRGLQVIDLSDVSAPTIIGRAAISGTPVEMYQVDNRVYVLLNNWYGYYGQRDDVEVERYYGGVVIAIDIEDPTNPQIVARAQVPGYIRTSRLTRGGGKEALYVVASQGSQTYVKSFQVSSTGQLDARSELSLGGYVSDIQATPERLLVARNDWQRGDGNRSEVAVIDISSPDGEMVEGQSVLVRGRVQKQFNMDMHGDILRVVSGGRWSTNANYLETFDASDIHALRPIDEATFGPNEDLYATLFLDDSAFFVTYRRVDPFHAFAMHPDGRVEEKSEFIVSGWNDYFRPVAAQTRLIGIGKNDENGRNTMAVSLYDITDLENPNPLIDRKEIELDWSWSEAQWDHRAYSVLEKAVAVEGPGGVVETGLVLLPYTGYSNGSRGYVSAVQIFTFSDDTLTLRGTMEHGTPVRRSFVADHGRATTANLSEAELSLYDATNPDEPAALGRLDLAPNYTNYVALDDGYAVRRQNRSQYYWWDQVDADRRDVVEIIAPGADPDAADTLVSFEIPAGASLHRVGDRLVTVDLEHAPQPNDNSFYDAHVQVWNLADPRNPALVDTLEVEGVRPGYGYGYGGYPVDIDYGWGYYGHPQMPAVELERSLVLVSHIPQRELLGTTHYETTYVTESTRSSCYTDTGELQTCTYYTGSITCTQLTRPDGTRDSKVCQGALRRCTRDAERNTSCEPVDPSRVQTHTYTHQYENYRHWSQYRFHAIDLSDAARPRVADALEMPAGHEAVGALPEGDRLHFAYRTPHRLEGDSRPFVRYFFRTIDFSRPSTPSMATPVNVPGELIAVRGDTALTRDYLWGENIIEASINKLRLDGSVARLEDVQRFVDQQVNKVLFDPAGRVLVSHHLSWNVYYDYNDSTSNHDDTGEKLTILDASGTRFRQLSQTPVDSWATLQSITPGRALYTVPGGVLVLNVDRATRPFAQAYFPVQGWPQDIVVNGRDIVMAAGRYGLYRFDIDTFNLVME